MGKTTTSITHKKLRDELKQKKLMKTEKGVNAIKKVKNKDKDQIKNDYEELKALLRLDDEGGSMNY